MIHGILNVYKEKGYTSHDVVAKLRGILRQKKIGHTGTLDPDAEGVLPVCLGSATKLCDMLTDRDKQYRAVLLLGQTTDTQDASGTVLSTSEHIPDAEDVRRAVQSFAGDYDQIPPMYSALKVNGKKLYELAREGKTVERQARRVRIEDIQIEEMDLPRVTMTVDCSKGTYIRTLCHDIGEKLGCGGCMESLLRTRAGAFCLWDSKKLEEIRRMKEEDLMEEILIPVDAMFAQCRGGRTRAEFDRLLYNGNTLLPEQIQMEAEEEGSHKEDARIRLYDSKGRFCGLYEYREDRHSYHPVKMFLEGQDACNILKV